MSLAHYLALFPIPPRFFKPFSRVSPRFQEDNQRLYLLWGETLEFFHDICVIIQLQEPRIELHLLGKREGIDIAVSDIAVYRVAHTLGCILRRVFTHGCLRCQKFTTSSVRSSLLVPRFTISTNSLICHIHFLRDFKVREHGREHRIVKSTIICNANSSLRFLASHEISGNCGIFTNFVEWTPI